MNQTKADKLHNAIAQAIGTQSYHKHWLPGILYTDGVAEVAEIAGAYWLIDAIASYQGEKQVKQDRMLQEFQLWTLDVDLERSSGILRLLRDTDDPVLEQKIEYTDFPIAQIKLYCEPTGRGWLILLPSEH